MDVSFANDILPFFRPIDIQHMIPHGVMLGDYDYMKVPANAQDVYTRLTATDNTRMPPPPAAAWISAQTQLFSDWMTGGYLP
jgi:hypothetical protein